MKLKFILVVSVVLILSLLAACGASESKNTVTPLPTTTPVPSPTPVPTPTATPYSITNPQLIDVGDGHLLLINCVGEGEPTIIFENGLDGVGWDEGIANQVKSISRNCRYQRRGMIGELVGGVVTTEDQVQDLHILLAKAGIPGPYILVGHSIAGLNLVLYTFHYPEEVAGLVCVDCRSPSYEKNLLTALGEAKPDEPQEIKDFRSDLFIPVVAPENLNVSESHIQSLKVTSLGDVPFIVLVAEQTYKDDPANVTYELNKVWLTSAEELSKLSSRGRLQSVSNANHMSITTHDEVIQAIREVVEAARHAP
jgi:hypothetical protein